MKNISRNSRTLNVIINILANYASQVIRIILEFVTRTLFIKILGVELLGVSGLFSNILLVLSLSELGLSTVVSFSYYQPLAKNDNDKLVALTYFYKKIYNTIAALIMLFGVLLIPVVHSLVVSENEIPYLDGIYLLYVLNTAVSYLFAYKTIILSADQKNYVIKKWDSVFLLFQSILQILVLIFIKNYLAYLVVAVVITFSKNLICALEADKRYPYLSKKIELPLEDKKEIAGNIKAGFIYKLSGVVLNGTDNILISRLVSTVLVGYLSNYNMILTTINTFVTLTFNGFTASIGNLVEEDDVNKKYQVFNAMFFIASWLARLFVPCIFLLMDEFVFLWIGKEFIIDKWSMIFKCCMAFLSFTLNPIYSYREAMGIYLKLKYVMLIAAVLNIIFSVILGILWGMPGILLASLIAMILTYIWYEPKLLYNEYFNRKCSEYFFKQFVNILVILFVIFVSKFVFSFLFKQVSWEIWVLKGIIICFVALLSCIILDGRKKEFKLIICKLKDSVYLVKNKS